MMKEVELLAPAGNFESLKVAINNGANAIYLGLTDFNARRKASNFTVDMHTYLMLKFILPLTLLLKMKKLMLS